MAPRLPILALLAFVPGFARADILAFSGFNNSADGWQAGDFSIPENANPPGMFKPLEVDFHDTGGDPTGYVQGFYQDTSWWCFVAPPAFLGDKSAAYGGFLQFDWRSILSDLPPRPALFLVGAGMTLSYEATGPDDSWSYTTATLVPSGWRLNNWATGPEPSEAQMQAVLGSLEQILITGQWESADISKTDLDNVQLAGPSSADLDGDGAVNGADLGLLLQAWGPCPGSKGRPCTADLDGDGVVDGTDLGLLLAAWNA